MLKSRVILTFMLLLLPTLACGLADQLLEPEATVAPPPTVDGLAPTSTIASDAPATDDGAAPTPTLAVGSTPGAPTLEELGEPPDSLAQLRDWVGRAHAAAASLDDVCAALAAAQWRQAQETCDAADLDGDAQEEWLFTIDFSRLQEEPLSPLQEGHPGDFWIVGDGGLLFQAREGQEPDFFAGAPQPMQLVDMTGDDLPEVVSVFTTCGAHTCYGYYQVIGAHDGAIRNLVQLSPQEQEVEESLPDTIGLAYVDREEIRDANGDDLPDLVIHGGIVGSAGAGIQRARTEVWAWSGEAITLEEQQWEETEYRFHWLYNANYAFEQEDYDLAAAQYEEVIINPNLQDVEGITGTAQETRDYTRQFAGFRLTLLPLLRGDITESTRWRNWLQEEYPQAPMTAAADRLFTEWDSNGNNLIAACNAVTQLLEAADNPTGPLTDMGYNNPSLTAESVCPIE